MSDLEDFHCTVREAILKAEKLKVASWPNLPIIMPLRVAVELLAAIAPLELELGKAIDVVGELGQLQEGEILVHEGQIII